MMLLLPLFTLLLYLAMLGVLGMAAWYAWHKHHWIEMGVLVALLACVLFVSADAIYAAARLSACRMGLPLSCTAHY
jgi:hypothetical protein